MNKEIDMPLEENVIFTKEDSLEYSILKFLVEKTQPIGSGTLSEMLNSSGFTIGEAKIGRLLRKMDINGFTKRISYKGRVITPKGAEYLSELDARKKNNKYGIKLIKAIYESGPGELLDILVVRKALEKEAVRLAAENIDTQGIKELDDLIKKSKWILGNEPRTAEYDMIFHSTIARLTKNRILAHTLDLLVKNRDLFPIFGNISQSVRKELVADHIRIIDAIKKGNAKEAENAMDEHITMVIEDVKKFYNEQIYSNE